MSASEVCAGNQFGDRLAILDDVYRPPDAVRESNLLVIDVEMMVNRRQEVVRADAAIHHVLAASVGGPNDPPSGDAATRPKHRVGLRPVVPARLDRALRPARHSASAAGLIGDPR